ncbi:MAG: Mur ligase family protein [Candidatus Moraniibacteriota bacterium]
MKKKIKKDNHQNSLENNKSQKVKRLERILRFMASAILRKYKPRIVAITGSVGKTSAKEAITAVLAGHFRIRKSEKNYNNEIGVPLTIIGIDGGGKSFLGWFLVSLKWLGIIIFPVKYPEILILEMAADRPGDLKYLTDFVRPNISVITEISASHLEYFKTLNGILKEKAVLVKALDEKGLAVINIDNAYLAKLKTELRSNVLSFGFSENADVRALDVFLNYHNNQNSPVEQEINGLSFKLSYQGTTMPMRLNRALAKQHVYAALAGISVGVGLGMNLVEIGKGLDDFFSPTGRLNLIPGIKHTHIIDDTYNSALNSSEAALEVLRELGNDKRKIVALGDMLELGENTEADHTLLARKFLEIKGDIFIAVGRRMQFAISELKRRKFIGEIYQFSNPMDAGKELQKILRAGDVVLVKGSQAMRMEKIIEEIMLEPQKAEDLLCRQGVEWKNVPWKEV